MKFKKVMSTLLVLLALLAVVTSPCFALWTTPTEADTMVADLVLAIGAFIAFGWTIMNASVVGQAAMKFFKRIVGKAV